MVGVPYELESDYVRLINAIKEGYLLRLGTTIQDQAEPGGHEKQGRLRPKRKKSKPASSVNRQT